MNNYHRDGEVNNDNTCANDNDKNKHDNNDSATTIMLLIID